jgi:hypothetical protein
MVSFCGIKAVANILNNEWKWKNPKVNYHQGCWALARLPVSSVFTPALSGDGRRKGW